MAVDYLQEYLGIDPNDYSAMEQRIAGVSPVGQSILPQAPALPRASIMDESDFAAATAPLMGRVYGREQAARTKAEDLANQLQGLQANLQEITNLRDVAVQDYQNSLQQQDVIRQQASENEAMRLEEQRNQLLAEREGIITTLEQDFGVQRSELESVIGGLEGQVGDLTSKVGELESVKGSLEGQINDLSSQMQALEVEKQDALAQQDVIRAEAAQSQQDALAQQGEQFSSERSALEQQIADLTAQVGQQQAPTVTDVDDRQNYDFGEAGRPYTPPSQDVLLDARRKELEDIGYDAADVEEILERDQQRGLENVTSNVLPDLISKTPPVIPPRPPQLPPKRSDQLFIDDRPRDPRLDRGQGNYKEFKGPDGQVLSVGVRPPSFNTNPNPRKGLLGSLVDKIQNSIQAVPVPPGQEGQLPMAPVNTGPIKIFGQTLSQEDSDRLRAGSEGGLKGIVNRSSERLKNNPNTIRRGGFFNKIKTPQPPTMTPRRQPMSVGGVGGISGRRSMRPMMRAGGGAIGQAIADLQNRLR